MKKVSDKELKKWLEILGANKIQWLYIESKIYLTQQQLDYVIELKNNNKKNKRRGKEIV